MSADEGTRPGAGRPEDVGSLADEATKLFGVLADWAREHEAAPPGATPGGAPSEGGPAGGDAGPERPAAAPPPTCEWCPLCRTLHWVRGASPEVRAHLASAAASLAHAASAMLAATDSSGGSGGSGGSGRPRSSPVEHIDLDPDPQPDPPPAPQPRPADEESP